MRSHAIVRRLWPAMFALVLVLSGCYQKEGDQVSLPTEPTPTCTSARPAALPAEVQANDCTGNGCLATYSIPSRGLEQVAWTFNGGSPAQSTNSTGTVTYRPVPTTFPADFSWSLTACSCSAETDPTGKSCASTSGRVVFETP